MVGPIAGPEGMRYPCRARGQQCGEVSVTSSDHSDITSIQAPADLGDGVNHALDAMGSGVQREDPVIVRGSLNRRAIAALGAKPKGNSGLPHRSGSRL